MTTAALKQAQPVPESEKIQEADYQAALKHIEAINPQAATMIDEAIMVLHENFQTRRAVDWTKIVLKASKDKRYIAALVEYAGQVFEEFGIEIEQEGDEQEEDEDLINALIATAPAKAAPVAATSAVVPQTATAEAVPAPTTTATTKPTRSTRWVTSAPTTEVSKAIGVAAIAFGLLLWVPGSRYALDGWTLAVNVVLNDVASLGILVPYATGLWGLLFIAVGLVYSIAEQKVVPFQLVIVANEARRRIHFLGWPLLFAWCAVHLTDVGATWIGVAYVEDSSWPIAQWMATQLWASVLWSIVLTYLPEVLIMAGWRWLGLPWPLWKLWSE